MGCSRVQNNKHYNTLAGTTLTVALTGVASGNAIALASTWDTSGGTTGSSIADDLSASATNIFHYNGAGAGLGQMSELWYYKNYGGGNRTWTLTTLSQSLRGIVVEEVSGADTSAPQQSSASANGNSATSASGNVSPTPTLNGTYLWSLSNSNTGTVTPTSPLVDIGNDGANSGSDVAAEVQSTAGAIGASFTVPSGLWQCVAATFKPAVTTSTIPAVYSLNEARSAQRRQDQIFQARSRGNPWFFSSQYTPRPALGLPLKFPVEIIEGRKKQQIHRKTKQHSFSSKYTPFPLIIKDYPVIEIILNRKHAEARRHQHPHSFTSKYTPFPPPPPPVTVPKIYNLFSYGRILDQKKLALRSNEVAYADQFFPIPAPNNYVPKQSIILLERAHLSRRWAHKRGPRSFHYIPPDIIPFLHWVPLNYGIIVLKRAHDSHRWTHRRHPKYYYYWNHVIIPFVPTIFPYDPAYTSTQRTTAHGSYTIWTKYKDRMKETEPRRMVLAHV